jgi:hypothetical protein
MTATPLGAAIFRVVVSAPSVEWRVPALDEQQESDPPARPLPGESDMRDGGVPSARCAVGRPAPAGLVGRLAVGMERPLGMPLDRVGDRRAVYEPPGEE